MWRRFDSVEIRDYLFRAIRRALAAVLDDLPKAFGLTEGDPQRRESLEQGLRVVQPMTLMSLGSYSDPQGAFLPSVLY